MVLELIAYPNTSRFNSYRLNCERELKKVLACLEKYNWTGKINNNRKSRGKQKDLWQECKDPKEKIIGGI